ncbi:MAG: fasciclin domain-containing protein [Saprospiraceae bacterium]|nr:fasciclin domain-containing protein [Saprospiraceae bacterium]
MTINAEGVFINDAKVTVTNLLADNGVVHVINAVLLPARTTVYDIIASSPDHTILETAIDLAGLKDALNGDGPFTVFAPTDAAIQSLPAGVLDELLKDPQGALKDILLYHVVGAQALSTDLSDGQEIQTLLANKKVRVTINAEGVFINDAKVTVTNLLADNGVVHVINAVLLPARTTVYDIIASSPDHTILETAIDLAGLKDALNGDGPFTVFAPTDAAIQVLPAGVLDTLLADPTGALKDILLYHVVGAQALSTDLNDGQEIQTLLANKKVRVTINAEGVFINDAKVTVADLIADNGVVHVINAVLLPARTTVYDIIASSPDHTILETAIDLAGLKDALNGDGPFTVFAPTDAAIQALPAGVLDELLKDPQGALKDLLLFHVANGKSLSTDLNEGQQITTLAGGALTVKINTDGLFINNAKVTNANLEADNGVVHVIDAVLTMTSSSKNIFNGLVKIYPNPFTDFVQIDLPNSTAQASKIEILDVQGKLIQSINSSSPTERIFVEGAPGTYILRLVTQDAIQEIKLFKNRICWICK